MRIELIFLNYNYPFLANISIWCPMFFGDIKCKGENVQGRKVKCEKIWVMCKFCFQSYYEKIKEQIGAIPRTTTTSTKKEGLTKFLCYYLQVCSWQHHENLKITLICHRKKFTRNYQNSKTRILHNVWC